MKTLLAGILLALASGQAQAAGSAGTAPFNFLFIDAGARATALGGAYTAVSGDPYGLFYNPASLGEVHERQAAFTHNMYFQEISHQYAAYADPAGWGVALNYLDFGKVTRTTVSNHGGALGSTGLTDLAFSAGYSGEIGVNATGGAALKYISENIAGVTGSAWALDLGLVYFPPMSDNLSIGAAVQNLGPAVKFQKEEEALPLTVRAGAAFKFKALGQPSLIAFDVSQIAGEDMAVAAGLETAVSGAFPLRVGYNTRNAAGTGVSFGFGYNYRNMNFDYAFVPFGDLGAAHRVSAAMRWGGKATTPLAPKVEKKKAEPEAPPGETSGERKARLKAAKEARYVKLLGEADSRYARKDYVYAALLYRQVIALEPDRPEPRLGLAEALLRDGKLAEADAAFEDYFDAVPEASDKAAYAAERRGAILSRLEKYSASRKQFMKAIEIMEERSVTGAVLEQSYFGVGYCYEKQDRVEEAIAYYKRTLQIAKNDNLRNQAERRLTYLEIGNR